MKKAEYRIRPTAEFRAAEGENGEMIVEGYAIVYDQPTVLFYDGDTPIYEVVKRGAAKEALQQGDKFYLWQHDGHSPMARESAGTLEVREDEKGVFIRADVSKTRWGRDGYEAIKNGVVSGQSFAFFLRDRNSERWDGNTREILKLDEIFEFSAVSEPAYPQTTLTSRSFEQSVQIATRNKPNPSAEGEGTSAEEDTNGGSDELELLKLKNDLLEKTL